ncbi:hypothetical protein N7G274_001083 [Stereocaulon virgatum]|uniref:Uncharacterized protein n=1 Tax=Stereocaulon virgatum TaxID=373712 RepID=A0ABR4ANE6_9LECA
MRADGRITKAYPPPAPRKLRERVGSRAITDLSAHTFGMQMRDSTLGGRPAKESSEPEPVKLPKEIEIFRVTGFVQLDQGLQDKIRGMFKHVKQIRKPKKTGFFDLPQELKDMIYKEVFTDTVLICTWSTKTGIPSYTQELELTPVHVPEDCSEGSKNIYDESDVEDSDADSVIIDDTWARDLEFHLYDDGTARHGRMQRQIEKEYLEHCISSY